MIGQVIGNYRIVSELGTGGMGVVYRAEHVQLGRPAALKMLLPQLSSDPGIVQRFFNEARTTSTIDHPGIVEIYDFGTHTDGRAYIVMELLKGESLAQRMRSAALSPIVGASLIVQAVGALGAAHARGIVHRDLKPDNIFLVPNELVADGIQVKLLDFGIAKLANDQHAGFKTQTGQLIGTPAYMSPEQCMGRSDLDHRTDLYAIGCILFHILSGRPPFTSEHGSGVIIAAHIRDAAPDPRTLNSQVPPALADIVMRLLEKEPSARFQTAHELRSALVAAGAKAPTTPMSSMPTPTRPGEGAQRYTGPDAFGATTAPTTGSGSAGQLVTPLPTMQPPPRRTGMWLGVGAGMIAGVAAFVVMSGRGDDSEGRTAKAPVAAPIAPSPAAPPAAPPATPPEASPAAPPAAPPAVPPAASPAESRPQPTDRSPRNAHPTAAPTEEATLAACPSGQERRADTHGECCWPEQAWSLTKRRCDGKPKCPAGMIATRDSCEAGIDNTKPNKHAPIEPSATANLATPVRQQRFKVTTNPARAGGKVNMRFPVPMYALPGEQFWITIVEPSAADSAWGTYEYVPAGARTVQLPVPSKPGDYEVRLHANYPTKTTNLVHRAPVRVEGE